MSASFITIAQAVQLTGKSRRTIQRMVESLTKSQPDQVMKEKTERGYIWKINEQAVRQAHGAVEASSGAVRSVNPQTAPVSSPLAHQPEKYLEVVGQGYAGMMTMHQDVKQTYEGWLKEKDERIAMLTQELAQVKKGFWAWLFGS